MIIHFCANFATKSLDLRRGKTHRAPSMPSAAVKTLTDPLSKQGSLSIWPPSPRRDRKQSTETMDHRMQTKTMSGLSTPPAGLPPQISRRSTNGNTILGPRARLQGWARRSSSPRPFHAPLACRRPAASPNSSHNLLLLTPDHTSPIANATLNAATRDLLCVRLDKAMSVVHHIRATTLRSRCGRRVLPFHQSPKTTES